LADLDARHRGPLPTIIAGDFNATPEAASIRYLSLIHISAHWSLGVFGFSKSKQRRRLNRLDQLRSVVLHRTHRRVDAVVYERAARSRHEQLQSFLGLVLSDVDPGLDVVEFEDHGHAVMYRVHVLVRRRRDDRAGPGQLGVGRFLGTAPVLVEAGEDHRLTVGAREEVGLFRAAGTVVPLVETVDGNGARSVSYTHLDVYKRQVSNRGHEIRRLQDRQVFADGLASHIQSLREVTKVLSVASVQPIEQAAATGVGERLEDLGVDRFFVAQNLRSSGNGVPLPDSTRLFRLRRK